MMKMQLLRPSTRTLVVTTRCIHTQGCGVFGAIGHGDDLLDSPSFKTLKLSGTAECSIGIKNVSAGWGHSAIVTQNGQLVIFGRPYDDVTIKAINRVKSVSPSLARFYGKFSSTYGGLDEVSYGSPQFVEGVDNAISAHCSIGFTVSLTKAGDVFSMGQDKWGQCGVGGIRKEPVYAPARVLIDGAVRSVDVGLSHCIALSECGSRVLTWGKGHDGQLGLGHLTSNSTPQIVKNLKGIMAAVSAGFYHSAAISSDGTLFVWGRGMASVLRSGPQSVKSTVRFFDNQLAPREVRIPGGRRATDICSSNFTLVIVCSDDSLWAMGVGEFDHSAVCTPIRVQQGIEWDSAVSSKDGYYNINTTDPSKGRKVYKSHVNDPKNDILNSKLDSHFLQELVQLSDPSKSDISEGNSREHSAEQGQGQSEEGQTGERGAVIMPRGAVLKKGFQRVAVLSVTSDGLMTSSSADHGSGFLNHSTAHPRSAPFPAVYEVVIHGGEAFLKAKHIHIDSNNDDSQTPCQVLDYSTGWQHSVLLLA